MMKLFAEIDWEEIPVTPDQAVMAVIGAAAVLVLHHLGRGVFATIKKAGSFAISMFASSPPLPPSPPSERLQTLLSLVTDHRRWSKKGTMGSSNGDDNGVFATHNSVTGQILLAGLGLGEKNGRNETMSYPWLMDREGRVDLLSGLTASEQYQLQDAIRRMCEVQLENQRRMAVGLVELFPDTPVAPPKPEWRMAATGLPVRDADLRLMAEAIHRAGGREGPVASIKMK